MKEVSPSHYKHHKSIFEQIKLEERSQWIQNMLATQQKQG